ncbi:putative polypeptide N-acetylgalactosaminyltransferase 8 [Varanus komodoensis]|nr:putative polypeptide N-acetylgalactosaminyltransferase 8 [Varanus komodoensis]
MNMYRKRKQDQVMKEEYKQIARDCRDRVRKAKAGNELRIEKDAKNNKKALFRYIQNKRHEKEKGVQLLQADGRVITDDKEKAEALSSYFGSVFSQKKIYNEEGVQAGSERWQPKTDRQMIKEYLGGINTLKSPEPDKLHPTVKASREISEPLAIIFEKSWETGEVSDDWRRANFVPIFRKGEKDEPGNYRPAWQCGGKVEVLPCSRVAHLERAHKPYLLDLSLAMKQNALRVAEVWMDEYKYMVYYAWNVPIENPGINYGDVSSRKKLREKLNCKSFDWYIKNVYPNLVLQTAIVGYGTIKNELSEDICIDQGPVPGNTPIMYSCHGYSPQHMFYLSTGELYVGGLRSRRNTVDRCMTDSGERELPIIEQCNEAIAKELNMHWDFKQGSSIINRKTKRCLEIVKEQESPYYRLVMQNCTGQKWIIQHTVKNWGKKETKG